MSVVKIQGNVSGTGAFTIAAPATNTDRTLTLPDAAGTIQVSGNPISGTTGSFSGDLSFNSGYGSAAVAYGCRAWARGNSAGGLAASGGFSSMTRTGTGLYTYNFATTMPDANYAISFGILSNTAVVGAYGTPSTTSFNVFINTSNSVVATDNIHYVAVFR